MRYKKNIKKYLIIISINVLIIGLFSSNIVADTENNEDDQKWTIHFTPGIRWGTDNRTLYILDFLIPLYQDEKNILFVNTKYTPNDLNGWEVNLGLGYRHILIDKHLLLGVNGFYDWRKTPWDTHHEQWGIGTEIMAEVPIKEIDLGLTGRFNYYHPTTSPHIELGPNGGYINKGNGVYVLDVDNIWIDVPMGGVDAELGVRIPYISDCVETWVYGGGYHFEGKYVDDVDGFSARLEVLPTDFLRLNYEYRNDRTNRNQHYGEVRVEVPFSIENLVTGKNPFDGLGKKLSGSRDLKDRLTEPVRRDVDVVAEILVGVEAAKALGLDYIVKIKFKAHNVGNNVIFSEEDIEKILKGLKIKGDIVFVSEDPQPVISDGSDEIIPGSIKLPYESITEAMQDERIKGQKSNTICVLNDTTMEYTKENPYSSTYAEGGEVNIEGVMVLGSSVRYLDMPEIDKLKSDLTDAITIDIPKANPTIGTPLHISVSDVTVMGLKFSIFDYPYIITRIYRPGAVVIRNDNPDPQNRDKYMKYNGINLLNNDFYMSLDNGDANGIFSPYNRDFDSEIGSEKYPLLIMNNTFNISTLNGDAAGINLNNQAGPIVAYIKGNEFSAITGTDDVYGIRLMNKSKYPLTYTADIVSEISDNKINIDTNSDNAYGIYGDVEKGEIIVAAYNNHNIDVTNNSGSAYGIYGVSDRGAIEGFVWNNTINVNVDSLGDNDEAFGIYLSGSKDKMWSRSLPFRILAFQAVKMVLGNIPLALKIPVWIKSINSKINPNEWAQPLYATVIANDISVISNSSSSTGVHLYSEAPLLAEIVQNYDVDGDRINVLGKKETYGVYLDSPFIGIVGDFYDRIKGEREVQPVIISGNGFNVKSIDSNAYCVYGLSKSSESMPKLSYELYAEINNNYMNLGGGTVSGITGKKDSYGIYLEVDPKGIDTTLESYSTLGSKDSLINIIGNKIKVESREETAYGIYLLSRESDIHTNISKNILENGYGIEVVGGNNAYGIYLSGRTYLGIDSKPIMIDHNTINVSSGGSAWGIYIDGHGFDSLGSTPEISCKAYLDIEYNGFSDENNPIPNSSGILVSGVDDAYGIYINSDKIGSALSDLKIAKNIMKINSVSGNAYGVFTETNELAKEGNIYANIFKNDMTEGITSSAGGDAVGILMKAPGGIIDTTISENTMKVYSEDSDAAGILLMARGFADDYSNYGNNPNITVEAPNGIAFNLIDALIVEDLAELNNQIKNGNTGWIYLKAGDYSGSIENIRRNNLSLWGEHYKMFGIGGGDYPVFNMDIAEGHLLINNTDSSYSGILGIEINVIDTISALGISIRSQNTEGFFIKDNKISVTNPSQGNAFGIYASSLEGMTIEDCQIIVNNISDDFYSPDNTYGIYVSGYDIGSSPDSPFIISNNEIKINYTKSLYNTAPCNVYGIYVEAENDIGSKEVYETIEGEEVLVSEAVSAEISKNDIEINLGITPDDSEVYCSSRGTNFGIYLKASNDILSVIEENDMSIIQDYGKVLAGDGLTGIYLKAGNDVGSENKPFTIKNNFMNLSIKRGGLLGIYSWIENDAFMDISGNDLYVANMAVGAAFFESFEYGISEGGAGGIDLDILNDFSGSISDNNFAVGGYDGAICIDVYTGNDIGSEENPFEITGNNILTYSFDGGAHGIYINGFDVMYADISNNVMKGGEIQNGEGGGNFTVPGLFSATGEADAIWISTTSTAHTEELPAIKYGSIGSSSCPVNISDNEMILISNSYSAYPGAGLNSIIHLRSFYDIYTDISGNKIVNYSNNPTVANIENVYWHGGIETYPPVGKGLIDLNFTSNEVELYGTDMGILLYVYPDPNAITGYSRVNMGSGPKGLGNNTVFLEYEQGFQWKGNYGNNGEVWAYTDDYGNVYFISP